MAINDDGVKRTTNLTHNREYNQKENCAASSSCLVRFSVVPAMGLYFEVVQAYNATYNTI